jgi:hypothetical protein
MIEFISLPCAVQLAIREFPWQFNDAAQSSLVVLTMIPWHTWPRHSFVLLFMPVQFRA